MQRKPRLKEERKGLVTWFHVKAVLYIKIMPSQYVKDDQGRIISIITFPNFYKYKQFTFEFHSYCGPWKLKKNGDPAASCGRTFWKVYYEWDKLSTKEKEKTLI
jgi:hypothetical protein